MTPEQVASEFALRQQQHDDDALLAAEAFAFGLSEQYIQHRQADILRRMNERFPNAAGGNSGETSGVEPS